jgi:trehalose-phosphatase
MIMPGYALDRWIAGAYRLWLFLDYDGTLADFMPLPGQTELEPDLVALIKELAANPRFRVTILTGRTLKSVQELVPVTGIFLAGVYGLEIQTPDGETIDRGNYSTLRTFLDQIKPNWETIVANRPEIFLEDKGWALALHAANVPLADARELLGQARQVASEEFPENMFRWFDSSNFLEIAPRQANKGETVNLLVKGYPYPGARLLYIGDDDKDEEAFEVVHEFGGLNIQVSNPENPIIYPGADYVLNSPHEVRKWLKNLLIT